MSSFEFFKKNWAVFPFLPFRVLFLWMSYYLFKPLADITEIIGSEIPGLKR